MRRKLILLNLIFLLLILLTVFGGWAWIGENYNDIFGLTGLLAVGIFSYAALVSIPAAIIWVILDSLVRRKPSKPFLRVFLGLGFGGVAGMALALLIISAYPDVSEYAIFSILISVALSVALFAYLFRRNPLKKTISLHENELAAENFF